MTMTSVGEIVYHTQTRQTGATVTVELAGVGPGRSCRWRLTCLNHGQVKDMDNRSLAIATAPDPASWCGDCRLIKSLQRPRIIGPKVR